MKTPKEQLSEKILDYWFALEFLSQDRYPDFRDIQNRVKKRKKDVRAENPRPRTAKGRKHLRINRTVRQHKGLCGGECKQGNYLCITKWRQDYSVAFLVSNQGNFY